ITCKPPKKIENGKYTKSDKDSFEYKEEVTYTCDTTNNTDEFTLIGEPKLVCTGHNKWSSDPPECKVVKCEYPVVQNGQIVSGIQKKFLYKAAVTFECNKGFYLEGSSTIVCGANSAWEPKMPKCIKGSTPLSTKSTISSVSGLVTFCFCFSKFFKCVVIF
ncbi:PREDICTED: membrane cofactor protein-like, partial [Miniopterus natalensis]|uniref:membrane cofactor protein-like n=1 Tax=Miniopterus natalensis TaxID=291302 RepID=UPI0007A72A47